MTKNTGSLPSQVLLDIFIRPQQEMALIGITMLWGGTFFIIHSALSYCGPMQFVCLRFAIAGLMALVLFRRRMHRITRTEVFAGLLTGGTMCLGYGLQTTGLQSISSSQSAFITALYVPTVPLLQWVLQCRRPGIYRLAGVVLSFAGLILLTGGEAHGINISKGEIATLIAAVAMAVEILLISYFARRVDARRLTTIQLLATSLFAGLMMPITGEHAAAHFWLWVPSAVGLGLATTLIQLVINWAQKTVPALRATLIYASEPVWGGLFGRLAGDRLPPPALIGAVLIVTGLIVSEIKPNKTSADQSIL